jgi:hypothetical protein
MTEAVKLHLTSYLEARQAWPASGKHVLAQHDASAIVVYQAYNRAIAEFAARHGHFGAGFSYTCMSWIKPNFLWMMYRCGWAEKDPNQERVLAITLKRAYFEALLARAVASSYSASGLPTKESWQAELERSDVRLQWDPDHDPSGAPLARRAIQLGLRDAALEGFKGAALTGIEDITDFVTAQREHVVRAAWERLLVPAEHVFEVTDPEARRRLGL